MVRFGVPKYKIICTFILFCFFQTSPSISHSTNNNYIYYSDVINDKYFKKIKFFKPEYMGMGPKGGRKVNLTNYSYIVKNPDKDQEIEYIVAIKKARMNSPV